MDYWDEHPLGGDYPSNIRDQILSETPGLNKELFKTLKKYNKKYYFELDPIIFKNLLTRYIEIIINYVQENIDENMWFVVPFIIAENGCEISNPDFSKELFDMIKDGNAEGRNYNIKSSNIRNNYNNFESPYDYACHLKDNWNLLMNGSYQATIKPSKGLFEKIEESYNENLINIR